MKDNDIFISVVIPFLNEQENLTLLHEKLVDELNNTKRSYEIILVDDGSTDRSGVVASKLATDYSYVKYIQLSRNFGQENAIAAGMKYSVGEVVVTMDADLQHPPKYIHEMIDKYHEGFQVVNSSRLDKDEGYIKRTLKKGFYSILNKIAKTSLLNSSYNFRLLSRKVVEELINLPETARFERGLIDWLGFNQCYIYYVADQRLFGETKYKFGRLLVRSIESITSFTDRVLRMMLVMGVLGFVISLGSIVFVLFGQSDNFASIPVWLEVIILLLLGIISLLLGVLSEYLSQVYKENKKRPRHIVQKVIL
jgi:polyisoprenyl-phosphate glycosyltransferase